MWICAVFIRSVHYKAKLRNNERRTKKQHSTPRFSSSAQLSFCDNLFFAHLILASTVCVCVRVWNHQSHYSDVYFFTSFHFNRITFSGQPWIIVRIVQFDDDKIIITRIVNTHSRTRACSFLSHIDYIHENFETTAISQWLFPLEFIFDHY